MKPGDKVWYYDDRAGGIYESTIVLVEKVEASVFYTIYDFPLAVCLPEIFHNNPPIIRIAADRAFPTREALCEHYRKIFE